MRGGRKNIRTKEQMDGSLFAQTAFAKFSAERPAAALKKAVWMGYHPHSFCLLISLLQLHRAESLLAGISGDAGDL
jgi:hypothetical protein